MGILEIPFHDSAFSWTMNSGADGKRPVSSGTGSKSKIVATDGGESDRPALVPKLRSFAIMALVIGAGVAYNRLQRRRAREAVEAEESSGSWLSRLQSQ